MNILEIFFQVFLGEFASFSLCTVEEKKNKTMNPLFDSYSSEFLQRLKLPVQSRGGFKE